MMKAHYHHGSALSNNCASVLGSRTAPIVSAPLRFRLLPASALPRTPSTRARSPIYCATIVHPVGFGRFARQCLPWLAPPVTAAPTDPVYAGGLRVNTVAALHRSAGQGVKQLPTPCTYGEIVVSKQGRGGWDQQCAGAGPCLPSPHRPSPPKYSMFTIHQ